MLKNRLSEYIRLVDAGEVILVTDRDHVVAELRPPADGRSERLDDAMIADAVRRGWLRPRLIAGPPPSCEPLETWEELSRELDLDREER